MAKRAGNELRIGLDFTTLDHLNMGGQHRYVVDLVHGLAQLPDSQALFVIFGSRPDPVADLHNVFQSCKNLEYRQIPRRTFRGSYLVDQLRYALAIRRAKLDVWHSLHTFLPAFCSCPIVATVYDLMEYLFEEYRPWRDSRAARIYRYLLGRKAVAIICISEATRVDLLRIFGIARARTSTVLLGTTLTSCPSPRDADFLLTRYPNAFSGQWLASPYNLEPRKNLRTLLRAFAQLLRSRPNLNLILFGRAAWSPEREKTLQAAIEELSLHNRVILTGVLSDGELAWVYRNCTAFVFPTLYEGFGLPLLEAMGQGACVIAHNASAMREVLHDAGILTDMSNTNIIAECVDSVLADEDRRKELGEMAARRAKSFTVERMVRQTLAIYRQVVN